MCTADDVNRERLDYLIKKITHKDRERACKNCKSKKQGIQLYFERL